MRKLMMGTLALAALVLWVASAAAQQPERDRRDGPGRGPGGAQPGGPPRYELGQVLPPFAREELKLTKDQEQEIAKLEKEVKERLAKLLTAEQKKKLEDARPPRFGGPEGQGGPGRPPEGGRPGAERPPEGARPGRPAEGRNERPDPARRPEDRDAPPRGGPGGPGGAPPRFELGHVFPPFAREELKLTKDQEKEIAKLEADVKERLSKILTAEQKKVLEAARPPRFGGPEGPGGPGRPPEGGRPGGAGRPPEGGRPDRPPE